MIFICNYMEMMQCLQSCASICTHFIRREVKVKGSDKKREADPIGTKKKMICLA